MTMDFLPVSADTLSAKYLAYADRDLREANSCIDKAIIRIASAILFVPVCAVIDLTLNALAIVMIVPLFLENGTRHFINIAAAIVLFVTAPGLLFVSHFKLQKFTPAPVPVPATVPTPPQVPPQPVHQPPLAIAPAPLQVPPQPAPAPQRTPTPEPISSPLPPLLKPLTPKLQALVNMIAEKSEAIAKEMVQNDQVNLHHGSQYTRPSNWTYYGDDSGWPLLNWAMNKGYTEIAKKLLDAGVDLNLGDYHPLSLAIRTPRIQPDGYASVYEYENLVKGIETPKVDLNKINFFSMYANRISDEGWKYAMNSALLVRNSITLHFIIIVGKRHGQQFDDALHNNLTTTINHGWAPGRESMFDILIWYKIGLFTKLNDQTVMERALTIEDTPETEEQKLKLLIGLLMAGAEGQPQPIVEQLRKNPSLALPLIIHRNKQNKAIEEATELLPELATIINEYLDSVPQVINALKPETIFMDQFRKNGKKPLVRRNSLQGVICV